MNSSIIIRYKPAAVAHNVQANRRFEPPVSNWRSVARAVSDGASTLFQAGPCFDITYPDVWAPVCRLLAAVPPLNLVLSPNVHPGHIVAE